MTRHGMFLKILGLYFNKHVAKTQIIMNTDTIIIKKTNSGKYHLAKGST